MRIIAGKAKGLQLRGPRAPTTRPTSDLVRGALFAMLESMEGVDWSRVLDLYAGTGALGIEALSRGADWADFVEKSPAACAIIRENLARAGLAGQGRVYCFSVRQAFATLAGKYGIILADPPYGDPEAPKLLKRLSESSLVGPGTVVAIEHSRRVQLEPVPECLSLVKSRRHGDTCISIFVARGDDITG